MKVVDPIAEYARDIRGADGCPAEQGTHYERGRS